MANSRSRFPLGFSHHGMPSHTPGPLGHNDASMPVHRLWFWMDTPGPTGHNDKGDPDTAIDTRLPKSSIRTDKSFKVLSPCATAKHRLEAEDYRKAARAIGPNVTVAMIRAFAEVESGGKSGTGEDGLPIIAFEGHIFRRLTHKRFDDSHPLLSYRYMKKAGPEWQQNNRNQQTAWATLKDAMELDYLAALQACSWGMFQVMGFNFGSCGYDNIEAFVDAMKAGERCQLEAFVGFCKSTTGLAAALEKEDFAEVARIYNGQDFGDYDQRIKKAYRRHCHE